jgi:MFS family permease
MDLHGAFELQASRSEAPSSSPRKRGPLKTRKVTIRLTEKLHEQLEAATGRPGVGKSMVVAAALEGFLSSAPSTEEPGRTQCDDISIRFDRLEQDMRMMAETIALHARYQLAIMPPLPASRQREAIRLGDERFKILAEQVDRRVRLGQPLMQETIDRLALADLGAMELPSREEGPDSSGPGHPKALVYESVEIEPTLSIAAEEAAEKASCGAVQRMPSKWGLIFSVFLPFAAGYFLSYLFRTINASISPALASEFGLGAAETGLLASVYFLVFAGAQIPIGVLLDRYGPRRVQSTLLIIAVGGATLFGTADSFAGLLIGRAMIGLGVAASLMAGLKAAVTWFPRERIALVNGCMIMLGSLGAVAATGPTDHLLNWLGWRGLFEFLTIATVATAALVYFATPEDNVGPAHAAGTEKPPTLGSIFLDMRFLRIAPLSATCIGSSWALQSLWAAPWLTDVEGLDRASLMRQLFTMAVGICVGALLLGMLADRLRKKGIPTEMLLAAVGGLFVLAELALILRIPLPSVLPWTVISVTGAGTVLSYAIIADYFPKEIAARANGALNVFHFSWAFVMQYGIGLIVAAWASEQGHYPMTAYQTAFTAGLVFQTAALMWFAAPWFRNLARRFYSSIARQNRNADHTRVAAVGASDGAFFGTGENMDW